MSGERTLPGLGLKAFWTPGSNGYNTELDAGILKLSVVVQALALSRVTAIAAQANGTVLIVPSGATSNANEIAAKDNGAWVYYTPLKGMIVFVEDEGVHVKWSGTAWVDLNPSASADTTKIDIITFTGSNRDTVAGDAGKMIRYNSSSDGTYTVVTDATVNHPVGTIIHVRRVGVGKLTLVAASGVTMTSSETLVLRKTGSGATLHKVAANTWEVVGDLELVP